MIYEGNLTKGSLHKKKKKKKKKIEKEKETMQAGVTQNRWCFVI